MRIESYAIAASKINIPIASGVIHVRTREGAHVPAPAFIRRG